MTLKDSFLRMTFLRTYNVRFTALFATQGLGNELDYP